MATSKRKLAKVATPVKPKGTSRKAGAFSIPKLLYAEVSPHSIGGVSMFDFEGTVDSEIVANFMSDADLVNRAAAALEDAGFKVLQISQYTINIAAPIATYERAFRTKIVPKELPCIKSLGVKDTATFFTAEDTPRFGLIETKGTRFENLIEGVAIEMPRYPFQVAYSPKKTYWHLAVPHDVSLGCNADKAHRSGITGRGIKIAMVDSGHFAHPFFEARGYRVQPVTLGPGAVNAAADENGHGTAESANIFAVAPDIELYPVKINFTNSLGAFNAAVGLSPDIITCSWGSDVRGSTLSAGDQALAVAIADAVARGIIVIFSAGNGHFGFPGQHPDVISAGGVFMDASGALRASDYASGFTSPVYPGRNAPDVCGLVGMRPRAAYIMLPLQPGCQIDVGLAGGTHPNGDETTANDGWAAISGTSAAAPQLAGAAALIKQACSTLSPAAVREILMRTAIDVTTGTCNPSSSGAAAGPGTDLATGAGLVNAQAAALVAKVRCLGPVRPPVTRVQPPVRPPVQPPVRPPVTPIQPVRPVQPIQPIRPVRPVRPPVTPITPVGPIQPVGPRDLMGEPSEPSQAGVPTPPAAETTLSAEEVRALEDLVIKGKIDPDKQ